MTAPPTNQIYIQSISGPAANSIVKKGILLVPYQGTTWSREIPVYSMVFAMHAKNYDAQNIADNGVNGYYGAIPEVVNMLLYNNQMAEANRIERIRSRGGTVEPFNPMFQTKLATARDAFAPFGITDTPAHELRRILGSMGSEKIANFIIQGQVKCVNYWGNDVCGGYHLYFVQKMMNVKIKDPVFHVSFGGTPASKEPANREVDYVPHWYAVAVVDPYFISQAAQYECCGEIMTGEAIYVGKMFHNPHFNKTKETEIDMIVERPLTSLESVTRQKHCEVVLAMSS